MKYKLLKDLPLAKAGTEVFLTKYNLETAYMSIVTKLGVPRNIGDIKVIDIPEWLEEIKEPKLIYDLSYNEEYWYIDTINTIHKTRTNHPEKNGYKGYEHINSFPTEREAKRNKLLRELATRLDKWLPGKGEDYYSWYHKGVTSWSWQGDMDDILKFHMGLVFRSEEEYNKYITPEAKDLLFNI